jgi:hypothetical protein
MILEQGFRQSLMLLIYEGILTITHFHPSQHKLCANEYRETMNQRFESWRELTGLKAAA